jgi:glycosyltransferase involved in cell wall biosynthesis
VSNKPKIMIQCVYFLQYNREENNINRFGGGIRYLRDIGKLFYKLGFDVTFIQKASKDFQSDFEGWANVYGIKAPEGGWGDPLFSKRALEITKDADLVCYGNMEDCFPYVQPNSFAIQHGIWWDYDLPKWKLKIQETRIKYVAKHVNKVICVDTNLINWYRTKWPNHKEVLNKLHYIPNYADLTQFNPTKVQTEKPILLFPRRFEPKRGYKLFLEMCTILQNRDLDFEVVLVGAGSYKKEIEELIYKYKINNAFIIEANFETISDYYKRAFLTFIPTLWSEGTSLSAIESIASGCPVISTNVGGLANIVIPGFNGEVLTPNSLAFADAAEYYLNNPELRGKLSRNCLLVRDSLSLENWEKRILSSINSLIEKYC